MQQHHHTIRVPVTVERPHNSRVWSLVFDCPVCGQTHRHGGGDGEQPTSYGTRVPHCAPIWKRGKVHFDSAVMRHIEFDLTPADAPVDWQADAELAREIALTTLATLRADSSDPGRWDRVQKHIEAVARRS